MFIVLQEWTKSLKVFSFKYVWAFLSFFMQNFLRASSIFLRKFWWIFALDAIFFVYFGDLFLQVPKLSQTSASVVSPAFLFLHLVNTFMFFVMSTSFLLLLRMPAKALNNTYFKIGFLRYLQLQLILSLIFLFFLNFLLSTGLEVLPKIHWCVSAIFSLVELLIVFYWLDSGFKLREIFYSLEKALNLLLYNLPFFVVAFFSLWCVKVGLSYIFNFLGFDGSFTQFLGKIQNDQAFNFVPGSFTTLKALKLLITKYIYFFLDYFFIALIFAFYFLKKDEIYVASVLASKEVSEELDE